MFAGREEDAGNSTHYEMVAGCAAGLENLVQGEVEVFGGQEVATGIGVVRWRGTLESAYRCCLWSRFASRVFLELWRFAVTDVVVATLLLMHENLPDGIRPIR